MDESLIGLRILNTRPLGQGKTWSTAIKQAGGIAIEFPVLSIDALPTTWVKSLPDLSTVDKAIFISANAVNACFATLQENKITWPDTIQVVAIGKSTGKALNEYNIHVDFVPAVEDSEHLLTLPCFENINGKSVLLVKGEGGRPLIEETLLAKRALLQVLPVYKRSLPHYDPEFIDLIWRNDAADIILLTSETAIDNIFALFAAEKAQAWLRSKPCLVISERLAKKAASLGIKTIKFL